MPTRHMLRGQAVDFDPSELLNVERAEGLITYNEPALMAELTTVATACQSILGHRDHPGLLRDDDPFNRLMGLNCNCVQPPFQIRLSITQVALAGRAVRELIGRVSFGGRGWTRSKKERQSAARAEKRARCLLHQFLTREQRWSLRADGSFTVQAQDGNTYRVRYGKTVQLIENGQPVMGYCIHPREPIPELDVMLIQKLLLETNLQYFLANANKTPLNVVPRRVWTPPDPERIAALNRELLAG